MTLVVVRAPIGGHALPLRSVPDAVFATELVGPGVAIDPEGSGRVVAESPVAGKIVKLHPHAFIVRTPDGAAVLVHLGVDTMQLAGEGFDPLVPEGSEVAAGAGVVAWDPHLVEAGGRSAVCPVVALDAAADALSDLRETGDVAPGDPLFSWTR